MKKILSAIILLTVAMSARAQEYNGLWHIAPSGYTSERGLPALHPELFTSFTVSESALKDYLASAPAEPVQGRIIALPTPEGNYRNFRVWSTPAMEEALAKKYPGIQTYTAEALDNRQVTAKLDYTPFGFHALVFDGAKTYLIDPYSDKADGAYIVYYKRDYSRPAAQRMSCEFGQDDLPLRGGISMTNDGLPVLQRLNGTLRKTYRLALACTGEYASAVTGGIPSKPAVLAKMVTTVNRVNGVYERELSVSMLLIAQEDTLIFLNGTTDPYTNTNGGTMLGQNQTIVDARIGNSGYDMGHVFSTGGGGIAALGCVCRATYKARGVTGSASPQGDAFDIDFVAHEMGHQFGANHTFNANTGSCLNNLATISAFEPGSGSTIMAYAGICTGNNIQSNSDAYFHSGSLEEISTFIINPATGGSCPSSVLSTNTNAVMPPYAATYSIPIRTPFELTAPVATDATANSLTYCWEQRDRGDFGSSLALTQAAGPLFRSFPPDVSGTRIFITPFRLLSGVTSYNAEKLPEVARTMTFRVTERDVYQGWGAFNFPDDAITLQVINTGTPFTLSYPAGGETITGGDLQTITWNVVGTNGAPINASTVDIYFSEDGGYTFPYLVKAGTPNDGSEAVHLPNPATTFGARIKVKASNNVFFNISGDFTVNHSTVGVHTTSLADDIRVSPVPASDIVHVSIPAALGNMRVRVVNTLGQAVWNGTLRGNASLPVGGWAHGLYYLQLSGDDGVQLTRKIIVE